MANPFQEDGIGGIKNFLNLAETHNFKIEEQDLNIDYTNQ